MRKVIIMLLLVFSLLGCTANNVSSPNNIEDINPAPEVTIKKQQYSFGPMADLSMIDDSTKEGLQNYLDKLGDPSKDTITFNGIDYYYSEDGSLFIDLFVRNGHSYSVFNVNITLDIIQDGKVIASAPFTFTLGDFGELPANMSRPWTILYYPEDIKDKKTKLMKFDIKARDLQYEY